MMTIFKTQWVELLKKKRPEYFTSEEGSINIYTPSPWGDVITQKEITGSKALDCLNTAKAISQKYGEENALAYIKDVCKKGL